MAVSQPVRFGAPRTEPAPWRPPSGAARPYNALLEQTPAERGALRRQQAEFADVRRRFDSDHLWMAAAPLAPIGGVLIAEGAAALGAAALLRQALKPGPLVLTRRSWINGHTDAARAGQRAHAELRARVKAKDGWSSEPDIHTREGVIRPDVVGPPRVHKKQKSYQMEYKPNTPSGRAAGARQAKKYERLTGRKTRVIFYDPEKYQ